MSYFAWEPGGGVQGLFALLLEWLGFGRKNIWKKLTLLLLKTPCKKGILPENANLPLAEVRNYPSSGSLWEEEIIMNISVDPSLKLSAQAPGKIDIPKEIFQPLNFEEWSACTFVKLTESASENKLKLHLKKEAASESSPFATIFEGYSLAGIVLGNGFTL